MRHTLQTVLTAQLTLRSLHIHIQFACIGRSAYSSYSLCPSLQFLAALQTSITLVPILRRHPIHNVECRLLIDDAIKYSAGQLVQTSSRDIIALVTRVQVRSRCGTGKCGTPMAGHTTGCRQTGGKTDGEGA